jgi:hypothetical protein
MLVYDRGARNYSTDWAPISAVNCRNGSETVIVTAENSTTAQNWIKAPCWGQHTQISCFACPYLTTNLVPKIHNMFVGFVSAALNLDPKTYLCACVSQQLCVTHRPMHRPPCDTCTAVHTAISRVFPVHTLLSVRVGTPGRHSETFGFDVAEGRI